jgi:hypothetical protein
MNRRGVSSESKREIHVSSRKRRQASNLSLTNANCDQRRPSNTPDRLSVIFLIIFGLFGWAQWFVAVTHIHYDTVGGGARIMQLRQSPMQMAVSLQEERRLVHQIQLNEHDFQYITHAVPKRDEFSRDWLGALAKEPEAECQPKYSWQLPENTPYSCNLIHEVPMDFSRIVGCGNDRCTVQVRDMQGHDVAFKTMR